jgi:S1-C subfamily serine protease
MPILRRYAISLMPGPGVPRMQVGLNPPYSPIMKALLVALVLVLFTVPLARADAPGPIIGIGTELKSIGGHPVVTGVLPDSPADKGGIKPNDRLLKIDDKSIDGLTLVQISHLLHGADHSRVKVTVDRNGQTKDFGLRRSVLFLTGHH